MMQVKIRPALKGPGFILYPTNRKERVKIQEHLAQFEQAHKATAFVQSLDDLKEDTILGLTRRDLTELSEGWSIIKNKVSTWDYWHAYVGYMST